MKYFQFLLIVSILYSCGSDDDIDPFAEEKKRVTNLLLSQEWVWIELTLENGNDTTAIQQKALQKALVFSKLNFNRDGSYTYGLNNPDLNESWELNETGTSILLGHGSDSISEAQIITLEAGEMKLRYLDLWVLGPLDHGIYTIRWQ